MATRRGVVGELREDFLECPICTEEYDEDKHIPRILPCQHSFCSECLSKDTRNGKLTCSMCKRSYKVKEKGIEHFPKDLTRRNLKDMLSKIALKSCSICNKMESVKYECMTCDVKLCRRCYKVRKSNDCKNHSVKELHEVEDETPDTSLDSFEIKAENKCDLPGHEKNALNFFCKRQGCRVPICANCATKGHKHHEWEELDQFYSTQKEQFLARLKVAKKNIHSAKEVLLFCRNENETITENARKGMEAINREKQEGINFINQETEDLSLTSKRTVKEFTDKFKRKESLLQSFIENARECCSISEKLLKESKTSFLSLEKAISDKLEIFGTETFHQEKSDIGGKALLLKEECKSLKNRIKRMIDPFQENSAFQLQITPTGLPILKMKRIPTKYEEEMSIIRGGTYLVFRYLVVLAALLFMFREYKIWNYLPYCEMEQCDETFLTFTNDSIHSSFCRSSDGKVASNIPRDDVDEVCELPATPGVFLNKAINFSVGYDKMDFQIRLTDFVEDTRGKVVLEIVFLTGPMYNPIHKDKLGWRLRLSKSDEILELLNFSNAIINNITNTSRPKIILKYRLLIDYSSERIKIQIVNRENRQIMDTIYVMKKDSTYLYTFFGLCEQYYGKISVKSLSVGRTFDRTTMFRRLHLSGEDKIASNYGIPRGNKTENSLILFSQDTEIYGCSKLCVIPFILHLYPFSLNEERWLELSFGSTTDTDEVLLLFDDTCTSYSARMFGYHTKCLSINENLTSSMIPNLNIFGNFSCVLLIDKENNLTSIDVNLQRYSFPMPRSLHSSHPILRMKLFSETEVSITLLDKMSYRYINSIINGLRIFNVMSYIINQVDMFIFFIVMVFYTLKVFITYIRYIICILKSP